MVSARRAARAGLGRQESDGDGVPDWVWGREFGPRQWVADHDGSFEGRYDAVKAWREERDAWLRERGLVMSGMRGLSYEELNRIAREEPHRVLRQPNV